MDDANPRSPLRTVQVLHELANAGQAVPLGVLAARLHLPKTSLFRLLRALEAGAYVVSDNGLHRVGPQALQLGAALLRNRQFPDCARPVLQWLASQCHETVVLGTFDDSETQIVYVDVIEPSNPLRFSIRPGLTKPLYCSASGQALLAYQSADKRAAYLSATQFEKVASNTVSGAAALKRRIKDIRAQGVAVSVDGMFDGVYSIAVPVFDGEGHARAGISISAPGTRGPQRQDEFAALLKKAGEDLSRLLGYTGVYPPD
jgi:DNA-binding IclR family transcriptional regulator